MARRSGVDDILNQYPMVQQNVNPGGFVQDSSGGSASSASSSVLSKVPVVGSILSGAGSILSALTTWYAVGQQRKENAKAREQQDKFFYENLGIEKQQIGFQQEMGRENLALNKRQILSAERLGSRQQRLAEKTSRTQTDIAKRGMTVQETESASNIALQGRAQTLNEKTAKFDQAATMITNMTRFFNSPQTRSQYAGLWKGYGR